MIKHLTPKSEEEILSLYKDFSPNVKLRKGIDEGLFCLIKKAIEEGADKIMAHHFTREHIDYEIESVLEEILKGDVLP